MPYSVIISGFGDISYAPDSFDVFRSQQGHGEYDNLGAKIKSQEMPQEMHIF